MALYYAPAIFIYLLSLSCPQLTRPNIPLLASLGIVVITTLILVMLPFALPDTVIDAIKSKNYTGLMSIELWRIDLPAIQQIFHRVFPFGRGLWEDKVANTWCATNILIKWRSLYSTPVLQKLRSAPDLVAPPTVFTETQFIEYVGSHFPGAGVYCNSSSS
jgi:alpha-1,3-glucosyltransferase